MTRGIDVPPITFEVGTGRKRKVIPFEGVCAVIAASAGIQRFKRYGRFRRWLYDRYDEHFILLGILPYIAMVIGGVFMAGSFLATSTAPSWTLYLLAYGLPLILLQQTAFRGATVEDAPEWLREYLRRRASSYQRLLTEECGLMEWARNVEVAEADVEALRTEASARREQIRAAMETYLDALRRATTHPSRVETLLSGKARADAAFPASVDGSGPESAAHVSLLAAAAVLRQEAVELGFPTVELDAFLRRKVGNEPEFDPTDIRC
jgi:hypothetical protein